MKSSENEKRYFIPVDGKLYETTKEIYEVYYQMDRRERYLEERDIKNGVLNFGDIDDANYAAEERIIDENADVEKEVIDQILWNAVLEAMSLLSDEENWLIQELFFYGKSEVILSKESGIARTTIQSKKYKAIEKIKKIMKI